MGSNYKKIQFEKTGNYGSIEKDYLYLESSRSTDLTTVYDSKGNQIFCFSEEGFDMGQALVVALSNWQDERMEDVTIEEMKLLKK